MPKTRISNPAPWTPLGAALLAYHNGQRDAVLQVDSDAFASEEVDCAVYYRPNEAELPPLELSALAHCRGRVLDVGAGGGRHALELQARGLEVAAIDIDPTAVQIMAERGVRDARQGDLSILDGQSFDSILLMMNGIGIAGDVAGLDHLLAALSHSLTPGGRIVCDSADLLGGFDGQDLENIRSAAFGDIMLGEVSFRLRFGDLQGPWYPWLFASPRLLADRAVKAGLKFEITARGSRGAYLAVLEAEQAKR